MAEIYASGVERELIQKYGFQYTFNYEILLLCFCASSNILLKFASNFKVNIMNYFPTIFTNTFFYFRDMYSGVVLVDSLLDLSSLSTDCLPNQSKTWVRFIDTSPYAIYFTNFVCVLSNFERNFMQIFCFVFIHFTNHSAMQTCLLFKIHKTKWNGPINSNFFPLY